MKYSILGFSQEEVVKIDGIDVTDLLLLDYIYNAVASPTMKHKTDEVGQPYVWLYHEKIINDLPILNIGEEALKKRLGKLKTFGLIKVLRAFNDKQRGSRSYYTITEKCEQLRFSNVKNYISSNEQVYQNTLDKDGTNVKKYTSNSQLDNIDTKLNNTKSNKLDLVQNQEFEFGKTKKSKANRYTRFVDLINGFTENEKLKNLLFTYLNMRLEIKDKPLYANQFKGMLNKLAEYSDSVTILCEIVQQSIDRGYLSFFPVSNYTKNTKSTHDSINESGSGIIQVDTKEDAEKREQFRLQMEAEGKKAVF